MNKTLDPTTDYYAVLGVSDNADQVEIKHAYRALARKLHPDSGNGDVAAFRMMQEAYEVLRSPALRKAYDRQREARGLGPQIPLQCDITLSRQVVQVLSVPQVVYVLVDIKPPQDLSPVRLPLNLALVIDRSTSMQGTRISNVKLAAMNLVDSLLPEDRMAIIAFSDRAETLVGSTGAQDKTSLRSAISQLVPGGGTEILQGLRMGLQEIRRHANRNYSNHLVLLTDGRTYGDEEDALAEAQLASADGIGISALGIGDDWNDLFLDSLARRGNGLCEYIQSPAQLHTLLQNHIRDLSSTAARNLSFDVNCAEGAELRAAFRAMPYMSDLKPQPGQAIFLGNLGSEAIVVMLELVLRSPRSGERRVARLNIAGQVGGASEPMSLHRDVFIQFVESPPTQGPPTARLVNLLARLSIFRLQERAWEALESGDVRQATSLLESAATRLFEIGYRQLGQATLKEADRVARSGEPTMSGRKTVRFGTRGLTSRSSEQWR
ncbi:MAG: VWA domain-containing protein [Anaerolineae bacterium]|nr:VWA domain-containing protein [Anaerolineae bacterium]